MIFVTQETKQNPEKRWALPDKVFFAAGACHILAYVFLEKYSDKNFSPIWIKPSKGHRGNHVFVTDNNIVFDYSGFSKIDSFIKEIEVQMKSTFYNWNYKLIPIEKSALISEKKSKNYDGLLLREPGQFLYNALPRAKKYLEQFEFPN